MHRVVLMTLGLALGAAPDAPAQREAEEDPVVEALEQDGVKGLRATFFVAASPGVVLETLWDLKRFRAIFPDIRELQILKMDGPIVDARFVVDAVFMERSYTLRRTIDRARGTVVWQSIGGDVKSIHGAWEVVPSSLPGVSRVTYTSFVDVGFFVPTAVVRDVAIGKVNEMAGRVRRACG